MKNKTIVIFGLLVAVLLIFFAVDAYRPVRQNQMEQATQALSDASVAVKSANAKYSKAVQDRKDIYEQCKVGVEAWNELTPALKAKIAMPDCELSFR